MNIKGLLIQFSIFSFLIINISIVLSLITSEADPKVLRRVIFKNISIIYLTVFGLGVSAVAIFYLF